MDNVIELNPAATEDEIDQHIALIANTINTIATTTK